MLYLWVMSISALGTMPRNSGGLCNIDLSSAGGLAPRMREELRRLSALRGFGGPRACGVFGSPRVRGSSDPPHEQGVRCNPQLSPPSGAMASQSA